MELGPGTSLHTPLVLFADPRWGGWKLDLGYRRPAPLAQTPYAHRCKPEFARSGPHTPILHALCAAGMIPKPMGQGPGRLVRAGVAFRSVPTVCLRPRNASWGAATSVYMNCTSAKVYEELMDSSPAPRTRFLLNWRACACTKRNLKGLRL